MINWGKLIFITILIFLGSLGYMIYVAYQQNNDFYDEDYYAKELVYQDNIDASEHLDNISSQPLLHKDSNSLFIQLPKLTYEEIKAGEIYFLRSNDKTLDKKIKLLPDLKGYQSIDNKSLQKGYYNVRISWQNGDKKFYREEKIFIQ